MTTFYVALGGTLGVLARYGVGRATLHHEALLWSTVAINVVGSFLLGVLVVLPHDWLSESSRSTIGVGLLGGFTTFSTFSVQAFLDFEAGEPAKGLLYVAASVVLGIGAAAAGYFAARGAFH